MQFEPLVLPGWTKHSSCSLHSLSCLGEQPLANGALSLLHTPGQPIVHQEEHNIATQCCWIARCPGHLLSWHGLCGNRANGLGRGEEKSGRTEKEGWGVWCFVTLKMKLAFHFSSKAQRNSLGKRVKACAWPHVANPTPRKA